MMSKWTGIRARSFLAFAVLTIFTILASLVGWVSYNRIGEELDRVVQVNVQSLTLMSDLKEYGTSITVRAPTLLVASDTAEHDEIWHDLNLDVDAMLGLLPESSEQGAEQSNLVSQIVKLRKTLESLNTNVSEQLMIKGEKQSFSQNLRWEASELLSEIDNAIQSEEKELWSDQATVGSNLQVLYRVKAGFSLLTNLIDRVQHLPDLSSLIAIRIHSNEVIDRLKNDLTLLKQKPEIHQGVEALVQLAQGENNIFLIRRKERNATEAGQLGLIAVRKDLASFNTLLSKRATQAELAAQEAAENVQATIKQGRVWSIFLIGGSLLFSILIVWLYIGHNIVARITSLNGAMRAIANGNLETEVPTKGRDEIGAMGRSLMSFRDQLSTLQEELVQSGKLAALGQLSAGLAHEINQPLSAIRHYTHNSTRLIQSDRFGEVGENLTHINLLTKRIITTITQLKSLASGQKANLVVIDVERAINNALLMLSGDKVLAETTLEVVNVSEKNAVVADAVQLEQVIRNLITNALDAVSDVTEKKIKITSQRQGGNIAIKVSDNGRGLAQGQKDQIFAPFFTTKKRGQNLGLGLAISYSIIKSFNGKLSVDAEQEVGATFIIQLPRYKEGRHEQPE